MKIIKYLLLFLIMICIFSCEEESGFKPPVKEAEVLTEEGWIKFEYGTYNSYQNALIKFEEAIAKDSSYAEPYCGAGWANARLSNLSDAVTYFTNCISLSPSHADAHAGLASVYNAQKEYQLSINSVNSTLSIELKWVFAHDQSVSHYDLRLLTAGGYFAMGNLGECLSQVQILNPVFVVDVFTFEGRTALAKEIKRLGGII